LIKKTIIAAIILKMQVTSGCMSTLYKQYSYIAQFRLNPPLPNVPDFGGLGAGGLGVTGSGPGFNDLWQYCRGDYGKEFN
jgi:hypothetical protein